MLGGAEICVALATVTCAVMVFRRITKPHTPQTTRPVATLKTEDGPEVIIVGAGVVGSAMAASLARDGRKVVLIERDFAEPDRIVGELMQPGGINALRKLGLEGCVDGIDAIVERGYIVHSGARNVHLSYPLAEDGKQHTGRSFHHGRFIMRLREAARAEANVTPLEATVLNLVEEDGRVVGVSYKAKGAEEAKELRAPLTVVADGLFSRFRKELVANEPKVWSNFVGLVMKNVKMFKENHAEVVLAKPSPILVYQIGTNDTRILVDVPGQLPSATSGELKRYMEDVVLPQLPAHLRGPFAEALESDRLRSMPNSFLPPAIQERRGIILLGDAFNMRHPLTGGGMSVGLHDVLLWRDYLRSTPDLNDDADITEKLRDFHWRRKGTHAFVVNTLAMALYKLFAAEDCDLEALREACFGYFLLGGQCAAGPVSLLSVLNPRPHVLIGHFFAVAFYAMYQVLTSQPVHRLPWTVAKCYCVLRAACVVIFPLIAEEVRVRRLALR